MSKLQIESGDVFKPNWDERLIRVLMLDNVTVFYDVWDTDAANWRLVNSKGNIIYYRLEKNRLLTDAQFLRRDILSAEEYLAHHANIPISLLQISCLQWQDINLQSCSDEIDNLLSKSAELFVKRVDVAELYLMPFGKKGRLLPGVKVKATNGRNFSACELLLNAAKIQATSLSDAAFVDGIGLYRSGLQKGLPSFYLWGAKIK